MYVMGRVEGTDIVISTYKEDIRGPNDIYVDPVDLQYLIGVRSCQDLSLLLYNPEFSGDISKMIEVWPKLKTMILLKPEEGPDKRQFQEWQRHAKDMDLGESIRRINPKPI